MSFTITIIGGGMGGCATALELANAGYHVVLIEMRDSLLSGSSDSTPCRLGLGFHYIDEETAIKYLIATIGFVKKYPGFKITDKSEFKSESYLQRGRYFVTKDTLFSLVDILTLYKKLQKKYYDLCKQDKSNQVFGAPEDFFRILSPSEYSNEVDISKVILGIETAEVSFNWPDFKRYFSKSVLIHPNITTKISTEVVDVKHGGHSQGFVVIMKDDLSGNITNLTTNLIVNASWQNIEAINHKVGLFMIPESRSNRLKVMIEVVLPENLKKKNSMFFCFGPHCSFTNLGNGHGFITYEPVTNIEVSMDLNPSVSAKRLLSGRATAEEKFLFGKQIITGVSHYIPEMQQAKFFDARFGIVRTNGKVNIHAVSSELHKRRESGIQEKQIGWIENACMKLLYFDDNAMVATRLVEKHLVTLAIIDKVVNNTKFDFITEYT